MKHFLLVILVLGLGASAFSQTPVSPRKTAQKVVLEGEREKFDPLRDSVADLQKAVAVTQKDGRRIILDVGGEWCVWCRIMDHYFNANPELAKLRDDNFIWLKVNMSEQNENKPFLSAYPEIKGYPHLFVLDSDGKFLHSQETEPLESGKSYDKEKFTKFLSDWSAPKKNEVR